MLALQFQFATAEDAAAIVALNREVLAGKSSGPESGFLIIAMDSEKLAEHLQRREVTVAKFEGALAGYTIAQDWDAPSCAVEIDHFRQVESPTVDLFAIPKMIFLHQICVDPRFHKRGVARGLYRHLFRRYPQHGVACFVVEEPFPNEASRQAHVKLGFQRIGSIFLARFLQFENHRSGVYFRPANPE